MIIGGFVGCVIDGRPITAAMAGYVGASLLEKVLPSISVNSINKDGEC